VRNVVHVRRVQASLQGPLGEAIMAVAPERTDGEIRFLDDEESRAFFDTQARRLLGISGEEFLRRYDAGEFNGMLDDPQHRGVMKLAMLRPFGR
jgi:hypothetical protein